MELVYWLAAGTIFICIVLAFYFLIKKNNIQKSSGAEKQDEMPDYETANEVRTSTEEQPTVDNDSTHSETSGSNTEAEKSMSDDGSGGHESGKAEDSTSPSVPEIFYDDSANAQEAKE